MHYIISSVIFIIIKIGFSHIYYHKNWLKLILQSSAADIDDGAEGFTKSGTADISPAIPTAGLISAVPPYQQRD